MASNRINNLQQAAPEMGLKNVTGEDEFMLIPEKLNSACWKSESKRSTPKKPKSVSNLAESRRHKAAQARLNQSWKQYYAEEHRKVHERVAKELNELEKIFAPYMP
jgi:uncharacterized Zn finger protein (UPF0148 family)